MAKSVIKQNKVVDDNNVNQAFLADNTENYYDGQALTISSGVVAPVSDVDEPVFGISCTDREADTLESNFKVNLRQPRTGDTFLLKTSFDIATANIGTVYGIAPEVDSSSNPTGGYVVSASGEVLQWKLISVFSKRYGEFEFQRYTEADAGVAANTTDIDDLDEKVTANTEDIEDLDERVTALES